MSEAERNKRLFNLWIRLWQKPNTWCISYLTQSLQVDFSAKEYYLFILKKGAASFIQFPVGSSGG